MKPLTREWVRNAERDLATATRELAVEDDPNYDAACFHGQQCAEKYLKAVLEEQGAHVPKTHDLLTLLEMLLPCHPSLDGLREPLEALTDFAVDIRYPGAEADMAAAADATETAREVRRRARLVLDLEE